MDAERRQLPIGFLINTLLPPICENLRTSAVKFLFFMSGFFRLPTFFAPRAERVSLPARTPRSRGNVVLSYLTAPFLQKSVSTGPRGHTNWQEARVMAETWREAGYTVEVVSSTDSHYVPPDDAFALIDIHSNLERWQGYPAPVKILGVRFC